MYWKARLTKTPYIVLFVMLISMGMTGAYALSITLDGDVISYMGTLDMNNNKITNVGNPIASSDAVTKGYVDSLGSPGGEILDMNNNGITNVGNPISSSDVVTKGYVDSAYSDTLGSLSCSVEEIPRWNGIEWECSEL